MKNCKKYLGIGILLLCISFSLVGCMKKSGDDLLMDGVEEYQDGNLEEALELLKEAEELGLEENEDSLLYTVIGHCYLDLEYGEEAIEYYKKALELDYENVSYVVNLAIAYRQTGDYETAKMLYQMGLELDPEYAELNSSLGTLAILEGDAETAITYFNKAIELDPSLAVPYGNGALAYAMIGDFDTADKYLQQAIVRGYENADEIRARIDELK